MKALKQAAAILGAGVWGVIAASVYVIAFALHVISGIFVGLTIMMGAADYSTRRGNRMHARIKSQRPGTRL
jgi:hypothetical protein